MNYLMIEKFNTCHSRNRKVTGRRVITIILLVVPMIIVLAVWMVSNPNTVQIIQTATERLALLP